MRTLRLWCDKLAAFKESDLVELEKTETHHFSHVLRGKVGESVELMNGEGLVAEAHCHEVSSKKAVFKLEVLRKHSMGRALTVLSPPPKGKRLPYMLEKLQELGVHRWIPLETEFSAHEKLSDHQRNKLSDRMQEACKQSGCAYRMSLEPMITFSEAIKLNPIFTLDIGGDLWREPNEPMSDLNLLVGPEAGWSDDERESMMSVGIPSIGLSKYHLRMETAALIGAARLLESDL